MTHLRMVAGLLTVVLIQMAAWSAEPESAPESAAVKPLEKTVQLDFKVEPVEGDDPVLRTFCAAEDYKVGFGYRNSELEFDIGISGTVRAAGSGRYLVSYQAKMIYVDENTGEEAEYDINGSAFVNVDQPKGLGVFDERTLTIILTEEDE